VKYKVILCDFDGTLATTDKRLTDYTVSTIKEYVKRGGIFIICTGRMHVSAVEYTKVLGTEHQKISVVSMQGACIKDKDGETLNSVYLEYETALKVLEYFENAGEYVHIYCDDAVLVEEYNDINLNYQKLCNVPLKKVGKISDYVRTNHHKCLKVLAVIPPEKVSFYLGEFDKMNLPDVKYFMASRSYFETVSKHAGKEEGLREVCKILGVEKSEVMAFGDNGNDMGMIQEAGFGVAVSNAREEVKKVADYVCESNDEDGVAKTIKKYCFDE
jgi:Cof subfamily protein (haloacid dehalogenase superfamily)